MKSLTTCVVVMLTLILTGCFNSAEIALKTLDVAGREVDVVADAAVARDIVYNTTLMNRDNQYKAAFSESGVKVEYALVDLGNGVKAYLPKSMTIRGTPSFAQKLETRPPDHRGWTSLDKALDALTFGLGAYFLNDYGKHSLDKAAPSYYGDYGVNSFNPVTNSTAEPYFFPLPE